MTAWAPDALLPGYSSRTIELPDEPTYGLEPAGSLVATLIRRSEPKQRRAVLYIHGWNDYFFQTHAADAFHDAGYDFYAIELRRYGRSLRNGQLAGYVPELKQYAVELDAALSIIREEGHDSLVLAGHSTGGLVASLYANKNPGVFSALVLNSPWIEFQGSPLTRAAAHPLMSAVSIVSPTTPLPLTEKDFYLRTISSDFDGEWKIDRNLKSDPAFRVRVGWLRAVMDGQQRIAKGLDIDVPILVLTSTRSLTSLAGLRTEPLAEIDIVLDVRRIAERAPDLGTHVTLVRVAGALHDVTLSAPSVRAQVFDEVARFLTAYAS
jgi:alpha-beta hydrolase superfamily lysophospholipase